MPNLILAVSLSQTSQKYFFWGSLSLNKGDVAKCAELDAFSKAYWDEALNKFALAVEEGEFRN
jgi:hypothetical protein